MHGNAANLIALDKIHTDIVKLADQMGEHEPRLRELAYVIDDIYIDVMEARAWKDTFGG